MGDIFASISRFLREFVVFWVMIQPWEQAIRVRLGKRVRRLEPGLHFRFPIIDDVHKQSVRWRSAFMTTQTLSTADGKTLVVGATLGYRIDDIEKLYRTLHHPEDTITQIAASIVAAEVLKTKHVDVAPDRIGESVSALLAAQLADMGFSDVSVRLTDFAFLRAVRVVNDGRYQTGYSSPLNTDLPKH